MFAHASRIALVAAATLVGGTTLAAAQTDVSEAPDNSWISVTGEVVKISKNEMRLDYGQGIVTVESASLGTYDGSPGNKLRVGENVTVHGYIDDGFYDDRKIEATTLIRKDAGSIDYGSTDGGAAFDPGFLSGAMMSESDATFSGRVKDVTQRKFTLVTAGGRELVVDTASMGTNPLDNVGAQRVSSGDRVSVSGELEEAVFDSNEIEATAVTVIRDMSKPGP